MQTPPPTKGQMKELKGLGPSQNDVFSHSTVQQRLTAHLPWTSLLVLTTDREADSQVVLSLLPLLAATPLQSPSQASHLLPG